MDELDLAAGVALVRPADPGYSTAARQVTAIEVTRELRQASLGRGGGVHFGDVQVLREVVGFVRRHPETGRPLGEFPLALPPQTLRTRAVWWTIPADQRARLLDLGVDLPGAAHAAEHASIGLLPLFAACDRWDVGGVSADLHPATGELTVFVYDGHDGGAGFAERGYGAAREWLGATADAIRGCECQAGCPSCIQSPKCGNGNEPLSKAGSVTLLGRLLAGGEARPAGDRARPGHPENRPGPGRLRGRAQEGGDPRRGGERGSPNGPAPGGQSRAAARAKPTCIRAKLPIGHARRQRKPAFSHMLASRAQFRRGRAPAGRRVLRPR